MFFYFVCTPDASHDEMHCGTIQNNSSHLDNGCIDNADTLDWHIHCSEVHGLSTYQEDRSQQHQSLNVSYAGSPASAACK